MGILLLTTMLLLPGAIVGTAPAIDSVSSWQGDFQRRAEGEPIQIDGLPTLFLWKYTLPLPEKGDCLAFANLAGEILHPPKPSSDGVQPKHMDYTVAFGSGKSVDILVRYAVPGNGHQSIVEKYHYDGKTVQRISTALHGGRHDPVWHPRERAEVKKPSAPFVDMSMPQYIDQDPKTGNIVTYEDFGAPGETRFFPDPTRAFGVVVFCDDAAGTSIGVVSTQDRESDDFAAGWQLYRRFWQEEAWGRNVTSFGWSPDGKYLFVGTNDIYGTGEMYQLDLYGQKATSLIPEERDPSLGQHCWSAELDAVDNESVTFHIRDYCDEDKVFWHHTEHYRAVPVVQERAK